MRTVIIANGDPPTQADLARWLRPGDRLICADGGARVALHHGLHPSVVIGDFDSLEPELLAALETGGTTLLRHPPEKDETDLELALMLAAIPETRHDVSHPGALAQPAPEIILLGALGGRVDHELANMLLLAMPMLRGHAVIIAHGPERLSLLDAREVPTTALLSAQAGDTVSLLPFGGDAHGIVTHGMKYPLRNESLFVGPARGVSNIAETTHPSIQLSAGMLLCIVTARH
jgi:thiamine pyrophosphokinase